MGEVHRKFRAVLLISYSFLQTLDKARMRRLDYVMCD